MNEEKEMSKKGKEVLKKSKKKIKTKKKWRTNKDTISLNVERFAGVFIPG